MQEAFPHQRFKIQQTHFRKGPETAQTQYGLNKNSNFTINLINQVNLHIHKLHYAEFRTCKTEIMPSWHGTILEREVPILRQISNARTINTLMIRRHTKKETQNLQS
ncbi:hypothetical protein OIU79_005838 [Salix purpurea]|uniref:Uncharacterized protein n=1 Tax=Salix purpurea TaxID=77065 RepID=A0A9Q0TU51_SALPP|nr:hypothetical protein OIU79_005838 [Salix purpurea]